MHYLDYAATTPVPRAVAQVMTGVLTEGFGNPSAQYALGREAKALVDRSRAAVAKALGCAPEQLIFTSCGTEGDNWAIRAALFQNRHVGKHIITTAVEHSAVLQCMKTLEREGYTVTYLKPDSVCRITAGQVADALREDTALVSMMLVNNETGTRYPLEEVSSLLKNRKTLLHTDAVQGFLKVPFTARSLGADYVTISAHKLGGPKGVGALYIGGKAKNAQPLLYGGGQESGLRPGTEATAQIAGFAKAVAHPAPGGDPGPYRPVQGLRHGAAERHPRSAVHRRGRRAPHPVPLPAGLSQRQYRFRPGQQGNLRLRGLCLPPGQVQPRAGGHGPAQEGRRRNDPYQLRPGDGP